MPNPQESEPYDIPDDPQERRVKRLQVVAQNIVHWEALGKPIGVLQNIGRDAIEDLVKNGQQAAVDIVLESLPKTAQLLGYTIKSKLE